MTRCRHLSFPWGELAQGDRLEHLYFTGHERGPTGRKVLQITGGGLALGRLECRLQRLHVVKIEFSNQVVRQLLLCVDRGWFVYNVASESWQCFRQGGMPFL